jgi:hypothetical protein
MRSATTNKAAVASRNLEDAQVLCRAIARWMRQWVGFLMRDLLRQLDRASSSLTQSSSVIVQDGDQNFEPLSS